MIAIKILYRFNQLAAMRINLTVLKNNTTGAEQALYRALFDDVSEEMQSLLPQIRNIFKHIKRRSAARDIMAIYFEDVDYQSWAETRGISVADLCESIKETLEEIDREIEAEAVHMVFPRPVQHRRSRIKPDFGGLLFVGPVTPTRFFVPELKQLADLQRGRWFRRVFHSERTGSPCYGGCICSG